MTGGHHLAQLNIGRLKAPIDDPLIADFAGALDRINALAETQPGFVWRLVGDGGDATDIRADPADPNLIVNMSVWTGLEALAAFVYRSDHRDVMRRRREWFEPMEIFMCLWWVPVGHTPTVDEAMARLARLAAEGPTAEAFTFRDPFPAPGGEAVASVLDTCA